MLIDQFVDCDHGLDAVRQRLRLFSRLQMNADQGHDGLKIVLHPVMDFPQQKFVLVQCALQCRCLSILDAEQAPDPKCSSDRT